MSSESISTPALSKRRTMNFIDRVDSAASCNGVIPKSVRASTVAPDWSRTHKLTSFESLVCAALCKGVWPVCDRWFTPALIHAAPLQLLFSGPNLPNPSLHDVPTLWLIDLTQMFETISQATSSLFGCIAAVSVLQPHVVIHEMAPYFRNSSSMRRAH